MGFRGLKRDAGYRVKTKTGLKALTRGFFPISNFHVEREREREARTNEEEEENDWRVRELNVKKKSNDPTKTGQE